MRNAQFYRSTLIFAACIFVYELYDKWISASQIPLSKIGILIIFALLGGFLITHVLNHKSEGYGWWS